MRIMQSVLSFSELYNQIVTEVKGGIVLTNVVQCGDKDQYTDVL
jgi:hypothetical protein